MRLWNAIKAWLSTPLFEYEIHPMKRSFKEGERLTEDELRLMSRTNHCPDCGGDLLGGPWGGCSQNVCCAKCHSEFNITHLEVAAVLGQRISDHGPRELGDRAWCYKL